MKHLNADELSAMLDGRLAPERGVEAERHLEECEACREAFAAASAQDQALERALDHDPGEAYFDRFAGRVSERIAAGGRQPAPGGSGIRGIGDWFGVPRNLALAGAVGAVVIGVGTALLVANQTPRPVLHGSSLAERVGQRAAAPAPQPSPSADAPPPPGTPPAPAAPTDGKKDSDVDLEPAPVLGLSEEAARQAAEFRARDRADAGGAPATEPARAQEVRRNDLGDEERVRPAAPAPIAPVGGAEGASEVKSAFRAEPLAKAAPREALEARLCGEVRDAAGRPLRFATVTLLRRGIADQTDEHGRFCVSGRPGRDSVVITALGFQPVRAAVALSSPAGEVEFTLEPVGPLARSSRRAGGRAPTASAADPDARSTFQGSLPDSLQKVTEYARRLTGVAQRSGDARQYEAAAIQWERLLASVIGSPLEIPTRGHIAEMRYHAWEAEPDQRRAQAAREALTAFLVRAPAGPERNRATLWLDQVAR